MTLPWARGPALGELDLGKGTAAIVRRFGSAGTDRGGAGRDLCGAGAKPIYEAMERAMKAGDYPQIDETPMKMLDPRGAGSSGKRRFVVLLRAR